MSNSTFTQSYETYQKLFPNALAEIFPNQSRLSAVDFLENFSKASLPEQFNILDNLFSHDVQNILNQGKEDLITAAGNPNNWEITLLSTRYREIRDRIAIKRARDLNKAPHQYEKWMLINSLIDQICDTGFSEEEIRLQATLSMNSSLMERSATNPYMAEPLKLVHSGQMHSLKAMLWLKNVATEIPDEPRSTKDPFLRKCMRSLIDHDNGESWGEVLVAGDTSNVQSEVLTDFKEWRSNHEDTVADTEMQFHLKLYQLRATGKINQTEMLKAFQERRDQAINFYKAWRDLQRHTASKGRPIPQVSEIEQCGGLQEALHVLLSNKCPFHDKKIEPHWHDQLNSNYQAVWLNYLEHKKYTHYSPKPNEPIDPEKAIIQFAIDAIEKLETNHEIVRYNRPSQKTGFPVLNISQDIHSNEAAFRLFYPGKPVRNMKKIFSVDSLGDITTHNVRSRYWNSFHQNLVRKISTVLTNRAIVAVSKGPAIFQIDKGDIPIADDLNIQTQNGKTNIALALEGVTTKTPTPIKKPHR